jgi:uncharacterized membrane protein HdeD (DUF308 family)
MSLTLPTSPGQPSHEEHASLQRIWLLLLALGLVCVFVGILAISFSFVATMTTVIVFGTLLLIAGVTEVVHAVMVRKGSGFSLHLLAAGLYLIVGFFMLEDPVKAATVLTLLLAAAFFVGGVLRSIFSVAVRFPGWPWVLLHGVVDLLLGGLILSGWPESSLRIIGILVGIDLIFHGWSWVMLALTVRTFNAARSV